MFQPFLKMFTVWETVVQGLRLLFCNLLDIFAPWPRKLGSSGPTVLHALRKWLVSFPARDVILTAVVIFGCSDYTLSLFMMAGVVLLSRSTVMPERFRDK